MTTADKYMKYRREHPRLPASYALRWAKTPDLSTKWEEHNYNRFTREEGPFEIELTFETESQCPMDDDHYGRYVDGRSGWDSAWDGNYPEPVEPFPLGLPYTSFASGAYSQDRNAWPYFIPNGIDEHFGYLRGEGTSKSVAWDELKQWVEDQIEMLFGGPLEYVSVDVNVKLDDVELGSASMLTDIVFDKEGTNHIFEIAEDMIPEAIEEAKSKVNEIKSLDTSGVGWPD